MEFGCQCYVWRSHSLQILRHDPNCIKSHVVRTRDGLLPNAIRYQCTVCSLAMRGLHIAVALVPTNSGQSPCRTFTQIIRHVIRLDIHEPFGNLVPIYTINQTMLRKFALDERLSDMYVGDTQRKMIMFIFDCSRGCSRCRLGTGTTILSNGGLSTSSSNYNLRLPKVSLLSAR